MYINRVGSFSCLMAMLVLVLAQGCMGSESDVMGVVEAPEEIPLSERVLASEFELYSANKLDGLSGIATSGESELLFETVRLSRDIGIDVPDHADQSDRNYNIAIRLSDAYGQSLSSLTEGSELPEQWVIDSKDIDSRDPIDPTIYQLARKAAMNVRNLDLDSELQAEKNLLVDLLVALANQKNAHKLDRETTLRLNKQLPLAQESHSRSAVLAVQAIESFWKPVKLPVGLGSSWADHSATMTYRYYNAGSSWQFAGSIARCNHGTCPLDSSMTYYTTHWGSTTYYALADIQMCSGAYARPHVCNNDTKLQQENVKNNMTYNTWGVSYCLGTMYNRPF